jgi:hypothetical protein
MEQTVELTLEQRILGELEGIKDSQTFMRIVLLGGDYRDIKHEGKLPLLDRQIALQQGHIDLQNNRIKLLEDDKIDRESAMRTTKVICGILATGGAALGTFVMNLITKH